MTDEVRVWEDTPNQTPDEAKDEREAHGHPPLDMVVPLDGTVGGQEIDVEVEHREERQRVGDEGWPFEVDSRKNC